MKRLIVNADDFGMANAVDLGIIEGHREGIITSASILTCGESAGHAARLAAENPALGVGVHLCLTGMRPVLDAANIPTITKDGRLLPSPLAFMSRLFFGLVDKAEIKAELSAQVRRAVELGITPTHLDGHQHLHVMPGVFPIVVEIASEFGIRAVRFPVGPSTGGMSPASALEKVFLEYLAGSQEKHIASSGIARPDRFYGLAQTGRLTADDVVRIINGLPDGTSELMCHPGIRDDAAAEMLGWGNGWQTELDAVTDRAVRSAVENCGVELVNFGGL